MGDGGANSGLKERQLVRLCQFFEPGLGNGSRRAICIWPAGEDSEWRIGPGIARAFSFLMGFVARLEIIGDARVIGATFALQQIEVPGQWRVFFNHDNVQSFIPMMAGLFMASCQP